MAVNRQCLSTRTGAVLPASHPSAALDDAAPRVRDDGTADTFRESGLATLHQFMTTTQHVEPYADEVLTVDDAPSTTERGRSIFVQPDVALHQSKAGTARRHLMRVVARLFAFAVGDAVAAGLAAIMVRELVEWLSVWLGHGQVPYASAGEFSLAVLVSVLLTGNYQRSLSPHSTLHLLMGSSLGALVVCWSRLWMTPTLGIIPIAVALAVITTAALFLMRGTLAALMTKVLPDEQMLIPALVISADPDFEPMLDARSGYRVAGSVALDARQMESRAQELARAIRRFRAEAVIVVGDVRSTTFAQLLEIGLRAGCEVLCTPPGFGVASVRPSLVRRGSLALIRVGMPSLQTPHFIAKRCVDVLFASLALMLATPVAMVIAALIRLDSPGPIFFTQVRIGLGGRRFRMIKFRSMRIGADGEKAHYAHLNASGDPRNFKIVDDPRISRIGRFLRRWSLDELPQFLNVLFGQMSLVGPRPVPEEDFVDYQEHHLRRLGAKPGITGLWQVSGRSALCDFEERVRLDTEYIDRWSLWLDLKILTLTLPAVVGRTGAY
jgi:exopolysaccharide biosynthesis polyprenyl glycosylphosphotransferase